MNAVDISVCIVTYQAKRLLRNCLQSIYKNTQTSIEVIVIDNASSDGTSAMLKGEFQGVRVIENSKNEGFTRPMNCALRVSQGRYLLQLNPDTIILPGALDQLAQFLDTHPEVGICGPKVLNQDHTLQAPCRRGESRPWAVISYFSGLSTLFPDSEFFGQYLMNYKDENETHAVAGVSGSCMLVRKGVIEQIGYLDERFFAFQEDADFCFRAREAGWEIYYVPAAQIVHYGSMGGSQVHPYRSIYEWHKSYYLFYRKNFSRDYCTLFNWLYYLLMLIKFLLTLLINAVRKGFFIGSRRPQSTQGV